MTISGRYLSQDAEFLELRVDVDDPITGPRISGDIFQRTGQTVTHRASFAINSVDDTQVNGERQLSGPLLFDSPNSATTARLVFSPAQGGGPPVASVLLLDTSGAVLNSFDCVFDSPAFRRVSYVMDVMEGLDAFDEYDTNLLESGGSPRVLSVESAFAEAGIEFVAARPPQTIQGVLAGDDQLWSRSELHAVMLEQLSLTDPQAPGWLFWLFVAHAGEDGYAGLMFDSEGAPRQGCAVFHDQIVGEDANATKRAQLRTYVHEIGHCFNLYHSTDKSQISPPLPNRPDALSWMNRPASYQDQTDSGPAAYWKKFGFAFDAEELTHLRHGFFANVVMGGESFGANAADFAPQLFDRVVKDTSGLELRIDSRASFLFGEPVVVELRLSQRGGADHAFDRRVHPKFGNVTIGIVHPIRGDQIYRPLLTPCSEPDLGTTDESRVYDSAYIGFGRDGHYFDHPGPYALRAVYTAPDGTRVVSNTLRMRVRAPLSRKDEAVADLLLGKEQGAILTFLGSRSHCLDDGNTAFDVLLDRHGDHPLAVYGELVRGFDEVRRFKRVMDGRIQILPSDNAAAERWLKRVIRDQTVEKSPTAKRKAAMDNITLNQVFRQLAEVQGVRGKLDKADSTLKQMCGHFETQDLPKAVLKQITAQAENVHQRLCKESTAE